MRHHLSAYLGGFIFVAICTGAFATRAEQREPDVENIHLHHKVRDDATGQEKLEDEEWLLDKRTCEVKRVILPHYNCSLSVSPHHGAKLVVCGSLIAKWLVRDANDPRSFYETIGEGPGAVTPSLTLLKKQYAGLRDDDFAKTIDADDFPKKFISVSAKERVENVDFETYYQVTQYMTMTAEMRTAVMGEAVVGNKKYEFNDILAHFQLDVAQETQRLAQETKDITNFLGDLHLESVEDPLLLIDHAGYFTNSDGDEQIRTCKAHS